MASMKEEHKVFTALSENDIKILEEIEKISNRLSIIYRQFITVFIIDLCVLGAAFIWYFLYLTEHQFYHTVILIVAIVLCIIAFVFSGFLTVIKLILDRKKIKGKLIERFSNNYIIANFWNSSRRIQSEILLIKDGYKVFSDNAMYLISQKCVWFDNRKRPNINYFRGIPNALDFNFETNIKKYKSASQDQRLEGLKDTYGNVLDIGFDATTLKLYEEDKFTGELVKEKGTSSIDGFKLIMIIIAVIIVIALIYIAWKTGQPTPVVATQPIQPQPTGV